MYQLPMLAKVPGLVHGFSTREEGNMGFGKGDGKGLVINNQGGFLRKLHSAFWIPRGVAMRPLQRGHEEDIFVVRRRHAGWGMMSAGSGIPSEALVTTSRDIHLFLRVADCIPIVLFDRQKGVLALVHAGRESTIRKIPVQTLRLMQEKFKVDPADVLVGMGPGIRSYILQRLPSGFNDDSLWQTNCHHARRGFLLDLHGYNRDSLICEGVPEENIEECPFDTLTDPQFFSHRRSSETGDPEGRHACAVGMVPIE